MVLFSDLSCTAMFLTVLVLHRVCPEVVVRQVCQERRVNVAHWDLSDPRVHQVAKVTRALRV